MYRVGRSRSLRVPKSCLLLSLLMACFPTLVFRSGYEITEPRFKGSCTWCYVTWKMLRHVLTMWTEHLQNMKSLFARFAAANLTVNPSKIKISQATGKNIGKVLGQRKVRLVLSINNLLVLTTRQELHRFLGMAGYYQAFCENFAQVVVPPTDLTSSTVIFRWSPDCQESLSHFVVTPTN